MAKIAICGDIHGYVDLMYSMASQLNPDVIIQLGDTGIALEGKTIAGRHVVPLDWSKYLSGRMKIPIKTYVIKGNHENFDFLEGREEIVPGLIFVPQKNVLEIDGIRFGILGGNYSPTYFHAEKLSQERRRHFTLKDIDAIKQEEFDVLLSHDGPKTGALLRGCQEITDLITEVQPSQAYHGHHHYAYQTSIGTTQVIGLNNIKGKSRSLILHEN